jgi:hypothetical protein
MTDMPHPSELELNEYIERALSPADHVAVTRHLEECADCSLLVSDLQHIIRDANGLAVLTPPAHAWVKLQSQLAASNARPKPSFWRPVWALATAALVVLAFFVGRLFEQASSRVGPPPSANAGVHATDVNSAAVRERVLLIAVNDHLERSQMVLVELANAAPQDRFDISAERQSADELLASNRLYRQTAAQMGDTRVAGVLDDLERVLVEIARGPSQLSMQQLADIQQRIESQGILFKVRVIRNNNTAYR